ncbi:uncharacterized protein PAC_09986 [Phialocephala subalpina]|uniref:Uncharacterized protein n=1 Tax=Phialocephala subalpina TaxID=576137 RepID=A0A1L7X4Z3_9HELO|nr:uncharacterized protein PAC_09986 [Phialocephala subalpina]
MSGPPSAPRGGPMSLPPFQPNVESLYLLSNLIQEAIHQFETSPSPKEKATALQSIQTASTKLSCLTTPLPQQFMQMNFGPNLNVAVRIALEMSLFEALRMSGSPLTCSSIASKTSSDPEFVLRISRVLAAFEILQESQDEKGEVAYAHTMVSRFLTAPPAKAGAKRLFDNMFQAQANSASGYYKEHELHSPNDPKNTAFTFAHGEKDKGIFDILEERPERMKLFNDAMTVTVQFGLKELAGCYPWGSLGANEDGIVLVDVGGGKGHVVKELKESTEAFKGKGKLVLQDMKVVLDGGVVVDDEAELMPYDFLTEEQPIKGANYFFKAIFHDWPDPSCLQILKNLKPAMIPTSANPTPKLLIIDLVLPDHSPPPGLVLRDINMLVIGGKERSLSQWEKLLGEGGFKIIGVHGQDGMPVGSVVECVLA